MTDLRSSYRDARDQNQGATTDGVDVSGWRGKTAGQRPTRSRYAHWAQMTTRWADVDVYGHMNNARYFELIDTVINSWVSRAIGDDLRTLSAIGLVAEVGCRYYEEITYPAPVDLGVVVDHVGRSSVSYRVGLFQGAGDSANAEATFVHVYVTNEGAGRHVAPIPEPIRAAIEALQRSGHHPPSAQRPTGAM